MWFTWARSYARRIPAWSTNRHPGLAARRTRRPARSCSEVLVAPTRKGPSTRASDAGADRGARERERVRRTRATRRKRLLAFGLLALVTAAVVLSLTHAIGGRAPPSRDTAGTTTSPNA